MMMRVCAREMTFCGIIPSTVADLSRAKKAKKETRLWAQLAHQIMRFLLQVQKNKKKGAKTRIPQARPLLHYHMIYACPCPCPPSLPQPVGHRQYGF